MRKTYSSYGIGKNHKIYSRQSKTPLYNNAPDGGPGCVRFCGRESPIYEDHDPTLAVLGAVHA